MVSYNNTSLTFTKPSCHWLNPRNIKKLTEMELKLGYSFCNLWANFPFKYYQYVSHSYPQETWYATQVRVKPEAWLPVCTVCTCVAEKLENEEKYTKQVLKKWMIENPSEHKIIILKFVCVQRPSLTWPAVMQSYKDVRKCLHHKKFQLLSSTDWFGTPRPHL